MALPEAEHARVERFERDLNRLIPADCKVGIAVSGGPDSLALLLLAAAVRPGKLEAATVDHGLRTEGAAEAKFVASVCDRLGVPHATLHPSWSEPPRTGLQEKARRARYDALGRWANDRGLACVAVAHHVEDQAETLLMRLTRGAGVRGLAGIRAKTPLPGNPTVALIRPVLGWHRSELDRICRAAGLHPIEDPSNADRGFERVRVRETMASSTLLSADAIARSAAYLADADQAIDWAAEQEWSQVTIEGEAFIYRPIAPPEVRRRIVVKILAAIRTEGTEEPRGREIAKLLESLEAGAVATLQGVRCQGGAAWRFAPAPERRNR